MSYTSFNTVRLSGFFDTLLLSWFEMARTITEGPGHTHLTVHIDRPPDTLTAINLASVILLHRRLLGFLPVTRLIQADGFSPG
jgi:hypothetical protein